MVRVAVDLDSIPGTPCQNISGKWKATQNPRRNPHICEKNM